MSLWQAFDCSSSKFLEVCTLALPVFFFSAAVSQLSLLKKHGVRLRKQLGQHILIDDNIARKIVSALGLEKSHGVIEIGSGLGALTRRIVEHAGQVIAVEVDPRLVSILRDEMDGRPGLTITQANFLKMDLGEIVHTHPEISTWKVLGNLPYYITSAILMKLVESRKYFSEAVITVQDEFARRLVAAPGKKDYSSLSIYVQYRFQPEVLFIVKPTSFFPRPDVRSAVVRLRVLERPSVNLEDEGLFFQTIRAAFGQRRKTLRKSLRQIPGLTPKIMGELGRMSGVGLDRRPEMVSIEEFASLSNAIKEVLG